MSCYHPLRLFRSGVSNPESGKEFVMVTSHKLDYVTKEDFDKRFIENNLLPSERRYDFQEIPCGVCIGCRCDYSARWTSRVIAESLSHEINYFVTLTYDDEHLPADRLLSKKDLQDFHKRLRNNGFVFRYYVCGEYGDKFQRPHYHGCYFGLHLNDLVEFSETKAGKLFVSPTLSRIWKNGYVLVGNLDYASAAYVTRYVLKKRGKWNEEKSPFFLMSRRPPIGHDFFSRVIKDGIYFLPNPNGSPIKAGLPHYLRLKYRVEAGNVDQIKKIEELKKNSSGFCDIDSFREYEEFLTYTPLSKKRG